MKLKINNQIDSSAPAPTDQPERIDYQMPERVVSHNGDLIYLFVHCDHGRYPWKRSKEDLGIWIPRLDCHEQ
jgi:hypothetical protein